MAITATGMMTGLNQAIGPAVDDKLVRRSQELNLLKARAQSQKKLLDWYDTKPAEVQQRLLKIGVKPGMTFEEALSLMKATPAQPAQPQAAPGSVAPRGAATQPEPKPLVYNDPNPAAQIRGFPTAPPQTEVGPNMPRLPGQTMPSGPLAGFASQPQPALAQAPPMPTPALQQAPTDTTVDSPLVWNPATSQGRDYKRDQDLEAQRIAQGDARLASTESMALAKIAADASKSERANKLQAAKQVGEMLVQRGKGNVDDAAVALTFEMTMGRPGTPAELADTKTLAQTWIGAKIANTEQDTATNKARETAIREGIRQKDEEIRITRQRISNDFSAKMASVEERRAARVSGGGRGGAKSDVDARMMMTYAKQLQAKHDAAMIEVARFNDIVVDGKLLNSDGTVTNLTNEAIDQVRKTRDRAKAAAYDFYSKSKKASAKARELSGGKLGTAETGVSLGGNAQPSPYKEDVEPAGTGWSIEDGLKWLKDRLPGGKGKAETGTNPGEDLVYDDGSGRGKKTPAPVGLAAYSAKIKAAYKAKGLPEPSAFTIMRGYRLTIPRGKK